MSDHFEHNEPNDDNYDHYPRYTNDGPTAGGAFVKGGCGCLIAFLVLGMSCVVIGGSMHIDILGALMLFVIGGILGLVYFAVYNKGRRDGGGR